jgi:hypothetical protein
LRLLDQVRHFFARYRIEVVIVASASEVDNSVDDRIILRAALTRKFQVLLPQYAAAAWAAKCSARLDIHYFI